jgi:hypothetical protein
MNTGIRYIRTFSLNVIGFIFALERCEWSEENFRRTYPTRRICDLDIYWQKGLPEMNHVSFLPY